MRISRYLKKISPLSTIVIPEVNFKIKMKTIQIKVYILNKI